MLLFQCPRRATKSKTFRRGPMGSPIATRSSSLSSPRLSMSISCSSNAVPYFASPASSSHAASRRSRRPCPRGVRCGDCKPSRLGDSGAGTPTSTGPDTNTGAGAAARGVAAAGGSAVNGGVNTRVRACVPGCEMRRGGEEKPRDTSAVSAFCVCVEGEGVLHRDAP
eukprot:TRINITY_DN3719_c0_g1_i9.p2 TRINITY_DN3719_c0_g1~~TRINITY_DN3719_c0_g1_i9.p2  ORF type:complete len:167 (-),score=9.81 TRINITY_DN3719_c0_g1_i9:52-552(-)